MRYGNGMSDIYILAAHPDWRASRINRQMLAAAHHAGASVTVTDLYSKYPDYFIDVAAEQAHMEAAKLVVMLHPIHWYSMPPLQKLWLDEVLTYGWAYGAADASHPTHGRALRGKDLWLVATTGGADDSYRPDSYNRYFFDAFLPPYEQTAALCGMRFLPPLILHGAHTQSDDAIAQHVQVFSERLKTYPHWPEMDEIEQCPACEVPDNARPEEKHSKRDT